MAAEKYIYGIKSIKFGTPTGSATMPVTLTQWAQTVKGSFTLSEAESQTKKFNVEETTTPVKEVVSDAGALSAKWRAYDMTPSLIAIVKGGTAGSETGYLTYAGPTSVAAVELAVQIESTNGAIVNVYKMSILARFDSAISAEQMLEMEVSGTALDPGSSASPYGIKMPNPA